MKKIFLALMMLCSSVFAQTNYNIIATAYVTTTISQNVVFNNDMRTGGTFTFSALAHNGGGRAGEADTANVRIQFYAAGGSLISTVNSSYSRNLPIPTAMNPPQADPSVPWTVLTVSSTNCGGSCSNVAYATVSMYGIDGSYWAGDYGPWYRAPTFQKDGGGNLLYNPEFGPAYGYNAQGWTTNPGMGACQGAWGGSNPCIVNSSGVPGSSTVGLVANENGGGPSTSGGTTSGTAGGYNNTMSVTNAGPGTGLTPVAPTVTGTSTTQTTQITIVGKNQVVTTTPVTTTTYSNGTTTTSSGTSTQTTASSNNFTGARFGAAQVADTQWNVQACTQTNRCQVYSTQPGGTYQTGSWTPIGASQYITFIPNTGSDSATNPWKMILVNNDGTFTSLGTGRILVQGVDANNNIFLFFTNDNYNGTLLSANLGLSGQGADFTGTANPSVADTDTLALGMSSTPLTAGQTGGTGGGVSWPATSDITTIQQQQRTQAVGRVTSVGLGNKLYLEQLAGSSNNTITVEQTGSYNQIGGLGGTTYAIVSGQSNNINIKQGDGVGKNLIEFSVVGNSNQVTVLQARNPVTGLQDGSESGGHYMGLTVNGSTNTLSLKQSNDGGSSSGHFAYVDVTGDNNTGTLKQSGNGEKTFFGIINGSGNVFDISQQGTGSYFDLSLVGNGHSVTANQKDAAYHKATVNLTNAGGPSTVNLVQQSSTAQNINITQQCATLGGCSVSITQGQ